MKRFFTYLKTELKLSVRDMNMPIFAIIMPLVIFIILGIIHGTKSAYDGASYNYLSKGEQSAISLILFVFLQSYIFIETPCSGRERFSPGRCQPQCLRNAGNQLRGRLL